MFVLFLSKILIRTDEMATQKNEVLTTPQQQTARARVV